MSIAVLIPLFIGMFSSIAVSVIILKILGFIAKKKDNKDDK